MIILMNCMLGVPKQSLYLVDSLCKRNKSEEVLAEMQSFLDFKQRTWFQPNEAASGTLSK